MAQALGFVGGVLFQPYIDLMAGWDPARLRAAGYREACHLQAEAVLEAALCLGRQGLLGKV